MNGLKRAVAITAMAVLGRRLSIASAAVMLGLGVLLVGGWYDALVQRLDIGT